MKCAVAMPYVHLAYYSFLECCGRVWVRAHRPHAVSYFRSVVHLFALQFTVCIL